jgi:hypothetical protein
VNARALLRPARRLWPQKVRTRLTLIYATLFFTAGLALLALTYGLVASSLPTRPPASLTTSSQEVSFLRHACKLTAAALNGSGQVPDQAPYPPECKQAEAAYYAGTAAGMQVLRQNTLAKLLGFWLLGLGVMTVAHHATVTARSQPAGGLDISVVIPRALAAQSQP